MSKMHATVSKIWNGWGYNITGTAAVDYLKGSILNDKLYGLDGDDTLEGGVGNDTLNGGKGADKMFGGKGSDTYFVDDTCDEVIECAGEGVDTVKTYLDYTLSEHVENITALGCEDLCLTGNVQNNVLVGNSGNNHLDGGAGHDILYGGDGNDHLYGGSGNDVLYGGNGDDCLNGEEGCDIMVGGIGNDTYTFSAGQDLINNCDDGCGTDVLFFYNDVCLSDVTFNRVCEDLVVTTKDGNSTIINDWFYGANNQLDAFFFQQENGSIDAQQINQALGKSAYGCISADCLSIIDDAAVQCQVQCVA